MVSINDRFEINAAIERLVDDGATFDPADAAVLIAKVPLSKGRSEHLFRIEDHSPSEGVQGYSPGHGNVRIDDDRPKVKAALGLVDVTRVGGYKLWHTVSRWKPWLGAIEITLMWHDTKLELNGAESEPSAMLYYNRLTGQPIALKRKQVVPFEIVFWPRPHISFILQVVRPVDWKTPAEPGSPAALEAARKLQERPSSDRQDQAEFVGGGALRAC